MRFIKTMLLAVLAAAVLVAACKKEEKSPLDEPWPNPPPGEPANVDRVIVILLDACRADHLGGYGYDRMTSPNMDLIAAEGALFENHYSQSHATSFSMPQIMSGRYYAQGVIESLQEHPNKRIDFGFIKRDPTSMLLPEVFNKAGWKTVCFSAHFRISENSDLGASFGKLYPLTEKYGAYPPAEKIVPHAQRWITENRDKKFFLYLHLMDTHFPHYLKEEHKEFIDPSYDWRKSFREGGEPKKNKEFPWSRNSYIGSKRDPKFYSHLNAVYDGDVKYVDKWVGKLWHTVKELGIEDHTTLVIMADHGEELGEHGWFGHVSAGPYDSIFHTPLIIVSKGRVPAGLRIKSFTENIDVYPTLAKLVNVPIPEGVKIDGRDLTPLFTNPDRPIREFAAGAIEDMGYLRNEKWAAGWFGEEREQLYDLESDPRGLHSVVDENGKTMADLRILYDRETAVGKKRWESLPQSRPEQSFTMDIKKNFEVDNLVKLDENDVPSLPNGKWGIVRKYLIGHGGGNTPVLKVKLTVPNAVYTVDVKATHTFDIDPSGASYFKARFPGGKWMECSTKEQIPWRKRIFRDDNDSDWKSVYVPAGVVEVKDGVLELEIALPDDPDKWVIMDEILLTPYGAKSTGLSKEERKRLKALGYLQ